MLRARVIGGFIGLLLAGLVPTQAWAASSSAAATSPLAGNGHNVTFDGRIFIVRRADNGAHGWYLMVFRPEAVSYKPGGVLDLHKGAFSAPIQVQDNALGENALAICEPSADSTPYPCDDAGDQSADGPYHCYDLRIFQSNAEEGGDKVMQRRQLTLWIAQPETDSAHLHKHQWTGGVDTPLGSGGATLRGIEPTVTRDGKLLLWQGHPNNDGTIDVLVYATSDAPCGTSWDGPHTLSHMHNDPKASAWPLAEKQLRAADGQHYSDGHLIRGAYPWLFPEGDALTFTATNMPCISEENPPGCGPRRNALSVMGYPTNWALAHIDGALNPSTTDVVRLFFSSPGPAMSPKLPLTSGVDVWPLFGTNTANAADVIFDDGLDGQYAGVWLMNESVNVNGELDTGHTPDTGGYFNTAAVHGATFPDANNGLFGKALVFDGTNDWLDVPHSATLNPVNGLTVELWMRPDSSVDCDGENNYRYLLGKGGFGDGAYSLVFEEGETFQARVLAGGQVRSIWSGAGVTVGAWSHVGFTYDAGSGELAFWINGEQTSVTQGAPTTLNGSNHPLRIGGDGGNKPSCPQENGLFHGAIDEVRISRVVRDLSVAARPGNQARFISQSVPVEVAAGEDFEATFSFRNVGMTAWSDAHLHRIGAQSPHDNSTWGTSRLHFEDVTHTGQILTVTATFTAPATTGVYPFHWRMVQEIAEWFGDHSDQVDITVTVPCGGVCDDGDACTTDTCDASSSECVFTPDQSCDDSDACTADTCNPNTGACLNTPTVDCDDGDTCTADTCSPDTGACLNTPTTSCDDADACTTDTCNPNTGACLNTPTIDCDDGVACTLDACDPGSGQCSHDTSSCDCAVAADCDDSNPCTVDQCVVEAGALTCIHGFDPTGACDDGDPCTVEACDEAVMGCVYSDICVADAQDSPGADAEGADAGAPGPDEDAGPLPDGAETGDTNPGTPSADGGAAPTPADATDDGAVATDTGTAPAPADTVAEGDVPSRQPVTPDVPGTTGPPSMPSPNSLNDDDTPPSSAGDGGGCASTGGALPPWLLLGWLPWRLARRRC